MQELENRTYTDVPQDEMMFKSPLKPLNNSMHQFLFFFNVEFHDTYQASVQYHVNE